MGEKMRKENGRRRDGERKEGEEGFEEAIVKRQTTYIFTSISLPFPLLPSPVLHHPHPIPPPSLSSLSPLVLF